jgi:adenylyltransferase/sulfurtransferase
MAAEALKLLCGIGEPLIGRLARYDALSARWDELRFDADPDRSPVVDLEEVAVACRALAPRVRADGISAGEVAARLDHGAAGLVVVDVRTAAERETSAIVGSVHVPLARVLDEGWAVLARALGESAVDGRDIVVTCQGGIRSARAIDALADSAPAGTPLRNLDGGMDAYLALPQ